MSSLAIENGVMLGAGDRKGVDYSTTTRREEGREKVAEREEGGEKVAEGAAYSEILRVQ